VASREGGYTLVSRGDSMEPKRLGIPPCRVDGRNRDGAANQQAIGSGGSLGAVDVNSSCRYPCTCQRGRVTGARHNMGDLALCAAPIQPAAVARITNVLVTGFDTLFAHGLRLALAKHLSALVVALPTSDVMDNLARRQ
jgi:hypothetical protein